MATAEEGQPGFRWDNWKAWAALSTAEFAVILILAAGLAHFVIRPDWEREGDEWRGCGGLASLERVNQTLQVAAKRWESCRNHTRMLEANTSSLSSQVAQLKTRLHLKELENKVLEDELVLLKNWTQRLQDLNNHQKEIIGHLQHLPRQLPGSGHRVHLHFGLASMLFTTIIILQV
ncbi:uncharacterized protein PHA67_011966 [Liasis olivaceus]